MTQAHCYVSYPMRQRFYPKITNKGIMALPGTQHKTAINLTRSCPDNKPIVSALPNCLTRYGGWGCAGLIPSCESSCGALLLAPSFIFLCCVSLSSSYPLSVFLPGPSPNIPFCIVCASWNILFRPFLGKLWASSKVYALLWLLASLRINSTFHWASCLAFC